MIDEAASAQEYINFTSLYLKLREKENRVYTDAEVSRLPEIERSHPHYKEWKIRKQSARHLYKYLKNKKRTLSILEIGCGNGWLSAYLSKNPEWKITGTDINQVELMQARRVFSSQNLEFSTEAPKKLLFARRFDIIIFAASIQYFSSLAQILGPSLKALHREGEIHIIDCHFYKKNEVAAAKKRSDDYYAQLGFREMSQFYHHHSREDLENFDPEFIRSGLFKTKFPWVVIRQRKT